MHELRNVDAVREIPARSGDECKSNHRLLPTLR